VAIQAEFLRRFSELRVIRRAVYVMTGGARHAMLIHDALDEVVTLHSVLVGGSIGEVGERGLAKSVIFKRPIVLEMETDAIADGPVVRFALDLFLQRLAL
jgi:hypothetical protein